MRIFVIYRHYWPDTTGYARLLRSIAERLAADGHHVTVFTAQPSYNDIRHPVRPRRETVGGVQLVRMPLLWEKKSITVTRILNAALFLAGAVVHGLCARRPDLVMVHSSPPAIMGAAGRLLSWLRSSRFLYHCQDLNPEAARAVGSLRNPLVYGTLLALENASHRAADTVVVLSEDMATTVRERGLKGNNLHVLNNFILESYEPSPQVPVALSRPTGDIYRVLFAGNHGLFQGLEHVIEAARLLADHRDIQFQFVGEGVFKARLMKQASELLDRNVRFHPYVAVEVAARVMAESDLGLIPLSPGVYRTAYPSKTMTLLAAGLPVLVSVESCSELARFVREHGIGWTCPPNDPRALADAILDSFEQRRQIAARRQRCRAVAAQHFGIEPNLDRWSALMRTLDPCSPS